MILNFENFNKLNENTVETNRLRPEVKMWLIEELSDWARTWEGEDEEQLMGEEKPISGFDTVMGLVDRLESDQLEQKDYDNIVFHLYQIKYEDVNDGDIDISDQDKDLTFSEFVDTVTNIYEYYN